MKAAKFLKGALEGCMFENPNAYGTLSSPREERPSSSLLPVVPGTKRSEEGTKRSDEGTKRKSQDDKDGPKRKSQDEEAGTKRKSQDFEKGRKGESQDDAETSKIAQRWIYCIILGFIVVVLVLVFFGTLSWLQYHSDLPSVNVIGGRLINYRLVSGGRPMARVSFNLTCDNPGDHVFTVSSGKLELVYNDEGGSSYTLAVVVTDRFMLAKRQKQLEFSGESSDSQWQLPTDLVPPVNSRVQTGLPVVLHGHLTAHYSASKVLKNINRPISVLSQLRLMAQS